LGGHLGLVIVMQDCCDCPAVSLKSFWHTAIFQLVYC